MYKIFLIFSILISPYVLNAEKIDLNTKIISARVYQGSANITRVGALKTTGQTGFRINNLGNNIVEGSVSIRFKPENSGIKIKRILVIPKVEKTFKDEDVKKLEQREESLSRKLKIYTEELESINKQRNYISSLVPKKKDITRDSSPDILMNTGAWSEYQKMLTSILDENSELEWKLLKKLDDTREELLVVESKRDYLSRASSQEHKDVEVELSSKVNKPVQVYVDYIIKDAYWYPRYEVKVDTKKKMNQISFYALVRNNTGEDWENAEISFSAADLKKKLDLPRIDEWKISFRETPIETEEEYDKRAYAYSKSDKMMDKKKKELRSLKERNVNEVADEEPKPAMEREELQNRSIDLVRQEPQKQMRNDYTKAKQMLEQGNIRSRSQETESNLIEFKNVYESQKSYYSNNDYNNAIISGKKAMERLSLIAPKYQSELSSARQDIEETVRKSALMQANSKITNGLISPLESSGGFDYRYSALGRKETILSDNSFNRVLVSRENLPNKLSYETAPIEMKSVFLTSNSVSRNKEPLLAGPLDIYVKEDYITTSKLNNTATGENLKFDLGPAKDIEIERKEDSFRETKGFFSKENSITKKITIKLKNRKKEKVSVLIVDRIPYTNDPKSKIETKNLPKGSKLSDTGILKYTVVLEAGKSKEIKYEYNILYPDKARLKEIFRGQE
ncbi:MAG: DUF4139 domain-containing protein [Leptospiraceae bacterium]|nr:DUF4139 domain-containing protein [Leptospiraceae bacterium]